MIQSREALEQALKEIPVVCEPDQIDLLLLHLSLVIEKNKELNLTRIDSMENGIYLHIVDSLLAVPILTSVGKELQILDLGTGGGFPGIPLAIALDAHLTLIDSICKKIEAVQGFIVQLGIQESCTARCVRSEELAREAPSSLDVVVARAVAQLNVLIELATPLLKHDGMLCAMKAHIAGNELHAAEKAAELCGMQIVSCETVNLPENRGHREIMLIQKTADASIKLPRRSGMATKRPFGL